MATTVTSKLDGYELRHRHGGSAAEPAPAPPRCARPSRSEPSQSEIARYTMANSTSETQRCENYEAL